MESRIVRQRDALLTLTTQKLDCDALPETLSTILEVTSATLDVNRVSIWRYNTADSELECVDLFDAATGRHDHGTLLHAADYPVYFRTMREADVVAADDAVHDPRTAEFGDGYLRPLGITSMMDVPIHLKGAVVGVLCHEHTGPKRRWTNDEKAFGIGVSNLISLAFERCERSRAEAALMLHSSALNAASHAMVITDRNARIVWTNPAFTALTGYSFEEAQGQRPRELLSAGRDDAACMEEMSATLLSGRIWEGELTTRRKDGSTYLEQLIVTPVRNSPDGSITHFVAIKRDLTRERQLEAQFLQAQKMEVVGRLAGGIAHDFNNMLTVINGSAELAINDLPALHPVRKDLERIHESGKRAASLTRQLLSFSRKQIAVREAVAVTKTLTEFRGILQRLIGEDIRLQVHAEGAGTIVADRSQFEQVILNLAVNARDAMPLGGVLSIDALNVDTDENTPRVKPGEYVKVSIADTGCGMSPEVAERIFEPFFTTKEEGKGTGLGLSTVYAIVDQAGGVVQVASEVNRGTTFTVFWPRVAGAAAAAEGETAVAVAPAGKTILLVEDEDDVREFAERVLRSAGYRVFSAGTAVAALGLLRRQPEPVDLIVTDVVLPGAGGLELAATAAVIRPGVAVLYTSGYTDDTVLAHGVEQQSVAFLPKPYSPAALLNKVRGSLSRE